MLFYFYIVVLWVQAVRHSHSASGAVNLLRRLSDGPRKPYVCVMIAWRPVRGLGGYVKGLERYRITTSIWASNSTDYD